MDDLETEKEMVSRIRKVIKRARQRGMSDEDIKKCFRQNGYVETADTDDQDPWRRSCSLLSCLLFKLYPLIFLLLLLSYPLFRLLGGYACLLVEISPFGEAVNPVVDCKICESVTEAPRLPANLSKDDFIRNYAYTSRPVLVVGAVSNWSALEVFSYDYFKSLYMNSPGSLEEDNDRGQFFAYSSNIRDLKDLFSLPSEVATMETEKWYIGW